ncbi:MAG: UvrD-helicase domain-containing protein [Candidatus Omnitrophica bacterium]|nr:UvrD-helicase domain-containing protein [Candidatus Omnitrophota bacterium]
MHSIGKRDMSGKNIVASGLPQILNVEASAGSGKTYYLAKKYLYLLFNPSLSEGEIPLNSILAITFTNKASLEMKERILDFLKKIALDSFKSKEEKNDLLFSLGVDENYARRRAFQIMEYLIRNYNFFQVQTIDSFINSILYGCAFRLGLSASFKTERYYLPYLTYSLDRLIDKASSEKEILELFREFIIQYLTIEHKTGWFPKKNILEIIVSFFSLYNKYAGKFIPNEPKSKELFMRKKILLKDIKILYEKLPSSTYQRFVKNLESFLETSRDNFDVSEISEYFKQEVVPIKKGSDTPSPVIQLWQKIRKGLKEICELESVILFNSYIKIFNKVINHTDKYSRKENILFLESLNKEANSLFKETGLGLPELYYRLSLRLRYFLIDEFQDTSILQWNNLVDMIRDALARGGSLFYVGDKKQAIFRFRGGEVSLFEEAKYFFRGFKAEKELLKINYRSRKEIVEFNNLVFSEENLRRFLKEKEDIDKEKISFSEPEIKMISEVFKDAKQNYLKNGGYVKLGLFSYGDKEEHDEWLQERLISLIKELNKIYLLKDIALLTRKNSEVEILTAWLLKESIPVESEKTLNVRDNSYIKEIVSFLKFLSHPVDNLSFAAFILGDIFCKRAEVNKETMHDFIFKRALSGKTSYLYRDFREEFPSFWENFIEEFFKSVGFVPLYELLITLFEKFSLFVNFPQHQGFFMKLLELVKEREENCPDILSFLEFFENAPPEELYVDVASTDAVKILTIHKAKGLGFPVVIIPFLEMVLEPFSQFIVGDGDNLRLLYFKKVYNDYSPRLSELYKREYLYSFIDELNALYVAFTRAEEELYIFSSPTVGGKKNFAHLLLPKERFEYGEPRVSKREEEAISQSIEISGSRYRDWIVILKDEFVEKSAIIDRKGIVYGEVMHWVLSLIGNLYHKKKEILVQEAIEKTRLAFPYFERYDKIKETVLNLLEHKEFYKLFMIEEGSVFQELELVNSLGKTYRLDRLIVKDKEVFLLDFKTSHDREDEDFKQVKEYISLLHEVYPHKEINGFLIYLDDFSLKKV